MSKSRNIFSVLRDCMGLTTEEMANLCGISRTAWSDLERGKKTKISDDFICTVSEVTGLPPGKIAYYVENEVDYSRILIYALANYVPIRGIRITPIQ